MQEQEQTALGTKAAVLQVKVMRRIIYDIIGTLSMGINS